MGTSSDHGGGVGGAWTPFKRAATSYAKHGGSDRAAVVLGRFVEALGGPTSAVESSGAGIRSAQQLLAFSSALATSNFTAALEAIGLESLVGGSRFDVLSGLADRIAGSGDSPESEAARSAVLDVLAELLPEGESFDELARVELDIAGIQELLELFLTAYVYNRAAAVIDQRLSQLENPEQALARDRELREYLRSIVRLRLRDLDLQNTDWAGDAGRDVIEDLLGSLYRVLAADA